MKFRDEDNLTVKVLVANSPAGLEREINFLCKEFDLLDLQYSTTGQSDIIEYSALALARRIDG